MDWDQDGSTDLLVSGGVTRETSSIEYFTRGACYPTVSYCRLGTCNHRTSKCDCSSGVEGQECTRCKKLHYKSGSKCKECAGHNTVVGVCSRRGVCDDDDDARMRLNASNFSTFKVLSATGTGQCKCLPPFSGKGCSEGVCPPGFYLQDDAPVAEQSQWYKSWQACMECSPGHYKATSGNEVCKPCPAGQYQQHTGQSDCVRCEHGHRPNDNRTECVQCDPGYVAISGSAGCTGCEAGTAPNAERSTCDACEVGKFAADRAEECSRCDSGSVPDGNQAACQKCSEVHDQLYALEDDSECRECQLPLMILGGSNWCTSFWMVLFIICFVVVVFLAYFIYGWQRVRKLDSHLKELECLADYQQLHSTRASPLTYGVWQGTASRLIIARKEKIKEDSWLLGVSLPFVLDELRGVYEEKRAMAEWRVGEYGPTTECGFRAAGGVGSFGDLPECSVPEDPNFHQMAALLTYGPNALGKGLLCPRDGKEDCSVVDAFQRDAQTGQSRKSGRANWFLSWVSGSLSKIILHVYVYGYSNPVRNKEYHL